MKKLLTVLLVGILTLASVFTFTACGAGSSSDDLQNVIKTGKLKVGITNFQPLDYKDAETGKWIGFDADFANAVATKLGVTAEFVVIDWSQKETELNSKNIDCLWNGFTYTEERAKNVDFSVNYMKNKQVVVVKSTDIGITKAQLNASNISIAGEGGSAGADVISSDFSNANFVSTDNQEKALLEVKAGTSKAAVMDYIMALSYVGKGTYTDLVILDSSEMSFAEEYYGIGFRKNSSLTYVVNLVINWMKDKNEIYQIASNYDLESMLTNYVYSD